MKSIVGDTLSVEARNLVPALIDAVVSNWSELNYATRQALEDAYPVFSSWDYRFDRASVGAGPFAFWISRFYALVPKEERSFDPRSTGVTFTEREKDAATQALIETADWLSQLGYAWTTPWELFHRLRRGTIQTGSAGGLKIASTLFLVDGKLDPQIGWIAGDMGKGAGSNGTTLVLLRPEGVEAWHVLPHGNSGSPSSMHYFDQGEKLYSHALLKKEPFREEEFTVSIDPERPYPTTLEW